MQIVKGIEIIAKRDKVTYATNVTGKWRDYSIETQHGKRVQETFNLLKEVAADDTETRQKAADNLRAMLTSDIFTVPEVVEFKKAVEANDSFVVTAGINHRTNRQLFLCTFEDADDFSITVVPTVMSKQRCLHMIEVARKALQEKAERSRVKMEAKIPEFAIVPSTDLPKLLAPKY